MPLIQLWFVAFLALGQFLRIGYAANCNEPQIQHGEATTSTTQGNYEGNYYYDDETYDEGKTFPVECFDSYWFKGKKQRTGTITCSGGSWSPGDADICVPATCEPIDIFGGSLKPNSACSPNGTVLNRTTNANDTTCLHCDPHFKVTENGQLMDSIDVTCGKDGKWIIPASCQNQQPCQRPNKTDRANSYSRIINFNASVEIKFECTQKRNMVMFGDAVVKCAGGEWAARLPVCRHKWSCLLGLGNGNVSLAPGTRPTHGPWSRNGETGTAVCDQGYVSASGNNTLTCRRGTWSPNPFCGPKEQVGLCQEPGLTNGRVTLSHRDTMPGVVATHNCSDGYELKGPAQRTCQHGGAWDGDDAECTYRPRCDTPPKITNAHDAPEKVYYHDEVYRYNCKAGYERRRGGTFYICKGASKSWQPRGYARRLECGPVSCGSPPPIANAEFELVPSGSVVFGAMARYRCVRGYKKTGGYLTEKLCQPNSRWTVISLRCGIMTCPPLSNPANGRVGILRGRTGRYEYNSLYRYTCNGRDRYTVKGKEFDVPLDRTCNHEGKWIPEEEPVCELVKCDHLTLAPWYNAVLTRGDLNIYGSIREFWCNSDATMGDSDNSGRQLTIACQRNRVWSIQLPSCFKKCHVGSYAHGNLRKKDSWGWFYGSELIHRKTVQLSCDDGYTTDVRDPGNDKKDLACHNGTLTPGRCTEKPCNPLVKGDENLKDVTYDTSVIYVPDTRSIYYSHGTTASITCKDRYEVTRGHKDTDQFTCDKGSWHKPSTICQPKQCRIPSNATSYLRFDGSSYRPGEYVPHNHDLAVRCPNNKRFSPTLDEEKTVKCGYGLWSNSSIFYDECEPRPCDMISKWSNKLERVDYSERPVKRGRTQYIRHGTVANCSCKTDYEVSEGVYTVSYTCGAGTYSGRPTDSICKAKGCRVPSTTDQRSIVKWAYNQKISYPFDKYFPNDEQVEVQCPAGYVFQSTWTNTPRVSRCRFGGWSDMNYAFGGKCTEAPCSTSVWYKQGMAPPTFNNVLTIPGKGQHVKHGTDVDISCKVTHDLKERARQTWGGYTNWRATSGSGIRTTCDKGKWEKSPQEIRCEPKQCRIPSNATSYLRFDWSSYSRSRGDYVPHNTVLIVRCQGNEVFSSTLDEKDTTKCEYGVWSNPSTFYDKCEPRPCDMISEQSNKLERVDYSKRPVKRGRKQYIRHDTLANCSCKTDYEVTEGVYTGSYTCDDGTYSGKPTGSICKAKGCRVPSTTDQRSIVKWAYNQKISYPFNKYFPHDEQVEVHCPAGYVFQSTWTNSSRVSRCRFGRWSDMNAFGGKCTEAPCSTRVWNQQGMIPPTFNHVFTITGKGQYVQHRTDVDVSCKVTHDLKERTRQTLGGYTNWKATSGSSIRTTCDKGEWKKSPQEISCQAICPSINVDDSIVVTGDRAVGGIVTVTCKRTHEVFARSGNARSIRLLCGVGGTWNRSTENLRCKPKEFNEYECDFSNGLCNWTHDPGDNFNWVSDRTTPDHEIGPKSDHTDGIPGVGGYMVARIDGEATGNRTQLIGPSLPASWVGDNGIDACLTFYYHMSVDNVALLRVNYYSRRGNGEVRVHEAGWEKQGRYGDIWWKAAVSVKPNRHDQLAIEAKVLAGQNGAIAIDDVRLLDGSCPKVCEPISLKSGVSVSGGNSPGEVATLKCLWEGYVLSTNRQTQVNFLCGADGSWNDTTDQLDCDPIAVPDDSTTTTVRYVPAAATTTSPIMTTTTEETTQAPTTTTQTPTTTTSLGSRFNCSFDRGLCNWKQNGSINWIRKRGATDTPGTGPVSDHTTKGPNGHYVYTETSRQNVGDTAVLVSPALGSRSQKCLEFYFHKSSSTTDVRFASILRVFVGPANITNPIWQTKSVLGMHWNLVRRTVSGYAHDLIRFEGVRGTSELGDIGMDDVSLSEGACNIQACPHIIADGNVVQISGENRPGHQATLECTNNGNVFVENNRRQLNLTCKFDGTWDIQAERRRCIPDIGCTKQDEWRCSTYQRYGWCTHAHYVSWMRDNCPNTCGFCN